MSDHTSWTLGTTWTPLNAQAVAVWLRDSASLDTARDFFEEFGGYDYDLDKVCNSCNEYANTISKDNICIFCGDVLKRRYVVTFQFSVVVEATSEDEAGEKASDEVSVDSGDTEDNYDLEVYSTYEE